MSSISVAQLKKELMKIRKEKMKPVSKMKKEEVMAELKVHGHPIQKVVDVVPEKTPVEEKKAVEKVAKKVEKVVKVEVEPVEHKKAIEKAEKKQRKEKVVAKKEEKEDKIHQEKALSQTPVGKENLISHSAEAKQNRRSRKEEMKKSVY